jgi:hypothetical protein
MIQELYPNFNIDYETYPHFHRLIDRVNELSKKDKNFKKSFVDKKSSETSAWIGLSTALKQIASQTFNQANGMAVVTVTDKSLTFNIGKGRGGKTFTRKQLKKIIY